MQKKCEYCKHWARIRVKEGERDLGLGYCHAQLPNPISHRPFAKTVHYQWCPEFEERERG